MAGSRASRKRGRGGRDDYLQHPQSKRQRDNAAEIVAAAAAAASDTITQADHVDNENEGSRTRDTEFWFDDGTVILVAGDVVFRVYKGLLAAHSAEFMRMFSESQMAGEELLPNTGCLVVPVDDSPEDLRHLLRACISTQID